MIVAGIGFRAACPSAELVALVREAMARSNTAAIACLATADFKVSAACLIEAADVLGVRLALISNDALAAASLRCLTRSTHPGAHGDASLAEAACLAAAGPHSILLQARIRTSRATCALAAT